MKPVFRLLVPLLLCTSVLCLGKGKPIAIPPSTQSLVTAVSPGGSGGTITISGDDAPFVVGDSTIILIDGQRATINDIHEGMRVLSKTAPDSVESEIDLKTVAADSTAKKKKKKAE